MKNVLCVIALVMFMLTACTSVAPAATATLTPTTAPTETVTSTPEPPTATATETATATPDFQISPDNQSFMNYSIPTDVIVNHTDDLVAKARALDWGPDATNPKCVNMFWLKSGELYFDMKTSPNYLDPSTRFFQRRVIGYNTDGGVTSAIVATRYQLPGLQPSEYPIVIGVIQTGSGQLKENVDIFLNKMDITVYQVPPNGVIPGGVLVGEYFKAHPEKIKIVDDTFTKLDSFHNGGTDDFNLLSNLNGEVLPVFTQEDVGGVLVDK